MDWGNNLLTESLWGDEAWSATLSKKTLVDIVRIVSHDTSPPLYYFFEHTWFRLFGTSEIAVRSLSFGFFVMTVVAVYLIGKKLGDKKTGWIAALLTATNPFLFAYAFEGRMYSLLLLTVTLSMLFYIKKQWWAYVVMATAALYTHHFAIFAVVAQGVWSIKSRQKLWWWDWHIFHGYIHCIIRPGW